MNQPRKAAIVTGASRGIGRGVALSLAERGYDLFLTHLDEAEEMAEAIRELAERFSARCIGYRCDLTEDDAPREVAQRAIEAFGDIHVLVNNAGVTRFFEVTELTAERMDELYKLDFKAPMLLTGHVARHMIGRGIRGAVVNIASSRAERAYPLDSVYGGMKAVLLRASQSAAIELAPHGIRVNNVSPGAVQVRDAMQPFYDQLGRRIPLGRTGMPIDVGQAVAWLASDEASYITGVNLRVDGGLILPGMPEANSGSSGWGYYETKER